MDLRPANHYVLPEELREQLAEPFGPITDTTGLEKSLLPDDVILAVGDVVSLTLHGLGIVPKLFVCDYKTQRGAESATYREALSNWGDEELAVENPAAMVTRGGWDAVKAALESKHSPVRIVVDGEEDLLGIPCLLEAPDGAVVLYGAPGRGVVVCRVDDELRAKVRAIVEQMESA